MVVAGRRDPEAIPRDDQWLNRSLAAPGDVTARPHRLGGTAYRVGVRELSHTQIDGRYDIHFDRRTRDLLVGRGIAQPDVYAPTAGGSPSRRATKGWHSACSAFRGAEPCARRAVATHRRPDTGQPRQIRRLCLSRSSTVPGQTSPCDDGHS